MAKICSVPINFLVMKVKVLNLLVYCKRMQERKILLCQHYKLDHDDGYEGAIVLEPKCDLYLDNPVACVDYASLYPSSMISENLSHDSKVWTKEYDNDGNLIKVEGSTDYDNLPGYKYIDIT